MVQEVENQTDLQSVQADADLGILQAQKDALDTAKQVKGVSPIEETAARIEKQKDLYGGMSFTDKQGKVIAETAANTFAGTAIARELQVRGQTALDIIKRDAPWQDRMNEVLNKAVWINDPTWNVNKNPHQMKQLEDLTVGYPDHVKSAILRAGVYSLDLAMRTKDYADEEIQAQEFIGNSGFTGNALMFGTSVFDVDTLFGAGLFNKYKNAAKLSQIQRYVDTGKLDLKAAQKIAEYSRSKTESIVSGAIAGMEGAAIAEIPNAALRPTQTQEDTLNAIAATGMLGAAVGSLSKTTLNVRDRAEVEVLRARLNGEKTRMGPKEKQSRGERNNNPGNIEFDPKNPWQGQKSVEGKGRFTTFKSPEYGVRAIHKTLQTYASKGVRTVEDIIERWSPKAENGDNTAAYIKNVADELGIKANEEVDLTDPVQSAKLVKAIIKQENGRVAYDDDTIIDGVLLAQKEVPDEGVRSSIRDRLPKEQNSSVGAAGTDKASGDFSPNTQKLWDDADTFFDENPDAYEAMFSDDGFDLNTAAGRLGNILYNGVNKTPLISDYQKMKNLPSLIAKKDVYNLLTSPIGLGANRRSADNLGGYIHESIASRVIPHYNNAYNKWQKDRGVSMWNPKQARDYYDLGHDQFNKELLAERNARYDGLDTSHFSQHIRDFSDRIDDANEHALYWGRDELNGGKNAVDGMQDIEHKAGWFRRVWQAEMFNRVINAGKEKELIAAMAEGIKRRNAIEDDIAIEIAQAIKNTRLAVSKGTGKAELMGSEIEAVADALKSRFPDLEDDAVLDIVDRLFQGTKDKRKPGYTKNRIDMDMNVPIEGTNYTLLDMIDNNVLATQERYYRSLSNHAALASVGIQKADVEIRKAAILDEVVRNSNLNEVELKKTKQFIDDIYSMFGEGAFGGGTEYAGRLNKLSRLSYLGGMMITQIAESGVGMGIVGAKQYAKFVGKSVVEQIKGLHPEDLRALAALNVQVDTPRLFKSIISADEISANEGHNLTRVFDKWANKGEMAMGVISGHWWMVRKQREVLLRALTARAFADAQSGKVLTQRWKSMGMDDKLQATLKKYIDQGDIKLNEDGDLVSANIDNWDAQDQLDFGLYLRSAINQGVQASGRGESSHWMHNNELGALMMNLRSFVITALQKQTIRNLRHADPELISSVLWTTMMAGFAYTARQIANGQDDNLSPEKIATGALGWGSMTGPAVMFLDPIAHMAGLDRIPGSPLPLNSWRYEQSGIVGLPGGLAAINDLAGIPRIPSDLMVDGELDYKSIKALKAIPVLGRSIAMTPVINALDE